jgi:hypothetical protein
LRYAVTFRYKQDPKGERQYGLIAEEVARVYPELVTRSADGKLESVHYLTLAAMLLNELQKQARQNQRQAEQIQQLSLRNQQLSTEMAQLRSVFEQATGGRLRTRRLATAFDR